MNLNRATYPQQLQTPRVNAANSALVPGYVRLAINKVRKALGIGQLGKLIAYTSVEQEHAWENLGITISQVIKENAAGSANDLDLLFSGRNCSFPGARPCPACPLNLPSALTRPAWIFSTCRIGDAQ